MAEVKVGFNRIKRMLIKIEEIKYKEMCSRISRLGFDVSEVIGFYPFNKLPARERLNVFLEYEECSEITKQEFKNDIEYACAIYPDIVINYINYVLDEVGVPPINEMNIYKELILRDHPDLIDEFEKIENKWKGFLK